MRRGWHRLPNVAVALALVGMLTVTFSPRQQVALAASPVSIVDGWTGTTDFDTGFSYTPGAGSSRVALVMLTAESNSTPVANVDQVTLGEQALTAIGYADGVVVGSAGSFHNLIWFGYLNETGIGNMSGNALNITWDTIPTNSPPIMVQAATYQNVDQTTPIADSASATNISASTIQAGSVNVGSDDRLVYVTTCGQPSDHTAPSGYPEQLEQDGPAFSHSNASVHRDATTSSAENPTATWTGTNRLAIISAVLNAVGVAVGQTWYLSSEGWYDASWGYRRAITLSPATSVADYQVLVTLTTATMGIPYTNVNSDGSDIRFTGADGTTLQDYWIESWNNTGDSKIWVEVKTSGTSTIYMYYGKSDAPTTSNGDNTFDFFDDFPGTSLDTTNKWDVINSGTGKSYSVSGGLLTIQSTGDWYLTNDTSLYVVSKSSFSFNYAAESLINQIGADSYPRFFGLRASSATNSRMFVMVGDSDRSHITNVYRDSDGGSAGWYGENSGISNPGNNKIARFERNGDTVKSYYNNSLMNTRTVTNWNLIKVALTDTLVSGTQQASKFDWIFVRKYTSPEPSASVGSEESSSYVMYKGDTSKTESTVTVADDSFEIWRADEAATYNVGFPANTWTGEITLNTAFPSGQNFTVEVGTHDTSFASYGSQPFTGDGTATSFPLEISASAFTVLQNNYLALRISNSSATDDLEVKTGGSNSYLTSPSSDPGYPIPELPTIILIGTGLACLGGYVAFKRHKKRRARI